MQQSLVIFIPRKHGANLTAKKTLPRRDEDGAYTGLLHFLHVFVVSR